MNSIGYLTVGADPEVFFVKRDGHRPQSVEGIVPGTKDEPFPIPAMSGYYIQADNVAAEFNIPPSSSAGTFSRSIERGLGYLSKVAKKNGCKLEIISAMHFPMDQLSTIHAQTLGCEPDLNAWTTETNPRPTPPPTLRTAAGHVHFGWKEPDNEQRFAIAKLSDLYLGVPSLLVTEPDERRSLYGKAGAIRLKPYGVEYRTLGNFWLPFDKYRQHIFNVGQQIAYLINKSKDLIVDLVDEYSEEIQDTINTHNKDAAIDLMEKFEVSPFPLLRAV